VTFPRLHTITSNPSFLTFNFTFQSFTKCLKYVRKWSSFLLEHLASKIQWKTQQIQSTFKPKYKSIKSQNIQHNSKIQSNNSKVNYKHESKIEKREEKEKKAKLKTHLNLSIVNSAWIPCSLHLPLLLFKTTPKLKKMENGEWNGVGFSPNCLDTLSFKGQKSKNCAGKRKGTKETKEPRADRGRTAVRPDSTAKRPTTTGRPWWCLALPFYRFLNAAFWCFFLVHRFCLGSSALGLLGLILLTFLTWFGLIFYIFS